ncbi:hypothetical protein Mgra_00007186 [Meloidogyne graminicola]|uniref:Uncharacterized protein n=1 Tax=Meloidogyne graminicola TaxID=189291 RepID=A0A8S9ZJM2_9BILA|nr:hypothetical protein Mgra_00007186 [Meloidogyne graminicola]
METRRVVTDKLTTDCMNMYVCHPIPPPNVLPQSGGIDDDPTLVDICVLYLNVYGWNCNVLQSFMGELYGGQTKVDGWCVVIFKRICFQFVQYFIKQIYI